MSELSWFERLFPMAMILLPLLTSLGRPSEFASEIQRAAHARVRTWLILGTVLCLVTVVVLWFVAPHISRFGWMLLFVLSPLSMRLINLRNPEVGLAHQRRRRSATLAPRETSLSPGARWFHTMNCLVWAGLLGATVWGLAVRNWADGWIVVFHPFALFWLIWAWWFARRTRWEAEPLPEKPSDELLEQYARFRARRQYLWIGLGGGAMLALALPPTLLAWSPEGNLVAAIAIGAGGGALGGVAGGVAGCWADRQRVSLARQVLAQGD